MRDKGVGALSATSPNAVRAICRAISARRPLDVVEFGPGTGVFTRFLLDHLHPDSNLLAIELNPEFARDLRLFAAGRRRCEPRLLIEHGNCAHVREILRNHGVEEADVIVSGIPLSLLEPREREHVVATSHSVLAPGGLLLVYQYSFLMRRTLRQYFATVRSRYTLLQFPPLSIMEAYK